jgi:hypothetical protein
MARCFTVHVRSLALLLLFFSAATTLTAQTQEWIRGFGGPGSEYGRFVEPTSDGGFAVAGTKSMIAGATSEQFWIARFDSNGTFMWQKTYGTLGVLHTIFTFSSTSDGGFMVGGFTGQQFSGSESALMFRVDSAGEYLWKFDVNYSSSDHWHLLIERAAGGYYFGGHTDSKDDPYGDMWLVRLDSARNVVWEKTYDRGTPEHAHAGIETRDGHVVMLGHTSEGGLEKWWLVKVDSNGAVRWQKVLSSGPTGHDSPYDIFETNDGNYALIGGTGGTPTPNASRGWLLVVDTSGAIVVDKHFGNAAAESFTWGGRQARDGGFILAGHTNYRTKGAYDMYVVKTDSAGTVEWEQAYGGTGLDYGFDIVETNDGYIGVGLTRSGGIAVGGEDDLMLVKITEDVELPAAVQLVSPANGTIDVAPAPELRWTPLTGATRYHLQIAADAAFTVLQYEDTTLTAASTTASTITESGRYFWRVRASNEEGWGPFSTGWSFEVGEVSSVGADAVVMRNAIVATPNPARDVTTLSIELDRTGVVEIALYDVRGAFVRSITTESFPAGRRTLSLDTRELAGGVYMVRVARGGSVIATTRLNIVR